MPDAHRSHLTGFITVTIIVIVVGLQALILLSLVLLADVLDSDHAA
jgi:hypothetical protein